MYFLIYAADPGGWVGRFMPGPPIGVQPCRLSVRGWPETVHYQRRYATYIAPPKVPSTSERTFYARTNALVSWLNAYGIDPS